MSSCLALDFSATGNSTLKNKASRKFYTLCSALGLCPKPRWGPRKEWRGVCFICGQKDVPEPPNYLAQFHRQEEWGKQWLVSVHLPSHQCQSVKQKHQPSSHHESAKIIPQLDSKGHYRWYRRWGCCRWQKQPNVLSSVTRKNREQIRVKSKCAEQQGQVCWEFCKYDGATAWCCSGQLQFFLL